MSHRIKPKEKYVRISMKEVWCNLDSPSKIRIIELVSFGAISRSSQYSTTGITKAVLCIILSMG